MPCTAVEEMELEQLLTTSDLTIDIESDETGSPEDADARLSNLRMLLFIDD